MKPRPVQALHITAERSPFPRWLEVGLWIFCVAMGIVAAFGIAAGGQ